LRLQRVDGRRFDAFVADLPCSRVHRGAAPIISLVSAPLVRVRRFVASAEGTDNHCSRAAMILLQSSSGQCRSRRGAFDHGHSLSLKPVARGTHDVAIGLCTLSFLFGTQGLFRLGRASYSLRTPTCCEYRDRCCNCGIAYCRPAKLPLS
jgi:hypothetical protein